MDHLLSSVRAMIRPAVAASQEILLTPGAPDEQPVAMRVVEGFCGVLTGYTLEVDPRERVLTRERERPMGTWPPRRVPGSLLPLPEPRVLSSPGAPAKAEQ